MFLKVFNTAGDHLLNTKYISHVCLRKKFDQESRIVDSDDYHVVVMSNNSMQIIVPVQSGFLDKLLKGDK